MQNNWGEHVFTIGPFVFCVGKYYDHGPKSPFYYFNLSTEDCLGINKQRGFKTVEDMEAYALKKVKRLYKQIGEAL